MSQTSYDPKDPRQVEERRKAREMRKRLAEEGKTNSHIPIRANEKALLHMKEFPNDHVGHKEKVEKLRKRRGNK
jgi:hypothetical protein